MLQYREIFKNLTVSDFKNNYQNTALGFAWSLLSPLLLMLILYFVFRNIFRMENLEVYLLIGIITWRFFAKGTNSALFSIVGKQNLVTNVYIPRRLITYSNVASSLIISLLEFLVLLPLALILGGRISLGILLFPAIHLLYAIMICGVGFALAALFVRYRDLQHIWEVFLGFAFFVCPILYPLYWVPEKYMFVYMLNPVAVVMIIYRDLFLYGTSPAMSHLLFVALAAIVVFAVGYLVFRGFEPRFAEEV
ncbi:MAG: ABC transporter permease [Dehalococcoidia bacterium]